MKFPLIRKGFFASFSLNVAEHIAAKVLCELWYESVLQLLMDKQLFYSPSTGGLILFCSPTLSEIRADDAVFLHAGFHPPCNCLCIMFIC